MRYREYRRKCEETKNKRAKKIAHSARYPSPFWCRKKTKSGRVEFADGDQDTDYIVKKGKARAGICKAMKKSYARKLRRSAKTNMTAYNGGSYKRASGDFWWDLT